MYLSRHEQTGSISKPSPGAYLSVFVVDLEVSVHIRTSAAALFGSCASVSKVFPLRGVDNFVCSNEVQSLDEKSGNS
jgi:hypothetical protein